MSNKHESWDAEWDGSDWENALPDSNGVCDGLGCGDLEESCFCNKLHEVHQAFRKEFKRPWRSLSYEEQKKYEFGFRAIFDPMRASIRKHTAETRQVWVDEVLPRKQALKQSEAENKALRSILTKLKSTIEEQHERGSDESRRN